MKRSKPSGLPRSPKTLGGSTTSWTIPRPTDVLSYVYLWHRQAREGREEGTKDRPVVIVAVIQKRDHGTQLLVVPVTTSQPRSGDSPVEMPPRVMAHLGLGEKRCWIVTDEYNLFTWPGPDIRPIRSSGMIEPRYGSIPARLFDEVRARIERSARAGKLKETKRGE